jgi:hypothetical protein
MFPEAVPWVLYQLDERYQQTPRVWPMHNKPFQQYSRDLFLNVLLANIGKKNEHDAREEVGVGVGVTQLVGDGVEHVVTTLRVQNPHHGDEDLHPIFCKLSISMVPHVVDDASAYAEYDGVDEGDVDSTQLGFGVFWGEHEVVGKFVVETVVGVPGAVLNERFQEGFKLRVVPERLSHV